MKTKCWQSCRWWKTTECEVIWNDLSSVAVFKYQENIKLGLTGRYHSAFWRSPVDVRHSSSSLCFQSQQIPKKNRSFSRWATSPAASCVLSFGAPNCSRQFRIVLLGHCWDWPAGWHDASSSTDVWRTSTGLHAKWGTPNAERIVRSKSLLNVAKLYKIRPLISKVRIQLYKYIKVNPFKIHIQSVSRPSSKISKVTNQSHPEFAVIWVQVKFSETVWCRDSKNPWDVMLFDK